MRARHQGSASFESQLLLFGLAVLAIPGLGMLGAAFGVDLQGTVATDEVSRRGVTGTPQAATAWVARTAVNMVGNLGHPDPSSMKVLRSGIPEASVTGLLGQGEQSRVFSATSADGSSIAVKVAHPALGDTDELPFLNGEARKVLGLHSVGGPALFRNGVVRIDVDGKSRLGVAMERVPGHSLEAFRRNEVSPKFTVSAQHQQSFDALMGMLAERGLYLEDFGDHQIMLTPSGTVVPVGMPLRSRYASSADDVRYHAFVASQQGVRRALEQTIAARRGVGTPVSADLDHRTLDRSPGFSPGVEAIHVDEIDTTNAGVPGIETTRPTL